MSRTATNKTKRFGKQQTRDMIRQEALSAARSTVKAWTISISARDGSSVRCS